MRRAIAASISFLLTLAHGRATEPEIKYANHIFNEIVSSARQFGSSLNHNGMAFFLATVPAGLEFYHGSGSRDHVNGLDWLALEPEHALVFARPGSNRVVPRKQPGGGETAKLRGQNIDGGASDLNPATHEPDKYESTTESGKNLSYGYLHTYRTRSDLRLLYLDGSSAAKSDRGTLDLQDLVLLHHNSLDRCSLGAEPEHEEDRQRAAKLCELARTEWQGHISGFIRVEAGFEIILCDFAKDLDLVRVTQTRPVAAPPGLIMDSAAYFKAIAARHDGVGGGRIKLDYEHHVSLFAYPDAIYFDSTGRPRVDNDSAVIPAIRDALRELVLSGKEAAATDVDWQGVADMIVTRYADRIDHLASITTESPASFRAEAERSLRPFIDFSNRNESTEITQCQEHGIPWQNRQSQSTAARAIREVSRLICSTLWSIAHSKDDLFPHDMSMIKSLREFLAWTEWKKCKGCRPNEFCFVPIWPVGSAEDFENPRCISDVGKVGKDYWRRNEMRQRGLASCTTARRRFHDHVNGSCPSNVLFDNVAEYHVCYLSDSPY